jgi:hypothetical protein
VPRYDANFGFAALDGRRIEPETKVNQNENAVS